MSGRSRLTVRVHPRARTERLEWDGSTLQLWVREPPADGRANVAVIRAVARWAGVAPSQVAIVSGAAARHKLVEIDRVDALPPPAVWPASGAAAITVNARPDRDPRVVGTGRRNRALAAAPLVEGGPPLRTTACPSGWSSSADVLMLWW